MSKVCQNLLQTFSDLVRKEAQELGERQGLSPEQLKAYEQGKPQPVKMVETVNIPQIRPEVVQPIEGLGEVGKGGIRLDNMYDTENKMPLHPQTITTKGMSGTLEHLARATPHMGSLVVDHFKDFIQNNQDLIKKMGLEFKNASSLQYAIATAASLAMTKHSMRMGYNKLLPVVKEKKSKVAASLFYLADNHRDAVVDLVEKALDDPKLRKLVEASDRRQIRPPKILSQERNTLGKVQSAADYALTIKEDKSGRNVLSEAMLTTDAAIFQERDGYVINAGTGLGKTEMLLILARLYDLAGTHSNRTTVNLMPQVNLINQYSVAAEEFGHPTMSSIGHFLMSHIRTFTKQGVLDSVYKRGNKQELKAAFQAAIDKTMEAYDITEADMEDILKWMAGQGAGIQTSISPNDVVVSAVNDSKSMPRDLTLEDGRRAWNWAFASNSDRSNAWVRNHYAEYISSLKNEKPSKKSVELFNRLQHEVDMATMMLGSRKFAKRQPGERSNVMVFFYVASDTTPHPEITRGDILSLKLNTREVKSKRDFESVLNKPKKGERVDLNPQRMLFLTYDNLQSGHLSPELTIVPALRGFDGTFLADEAHELSTSAFTHHQRLANYIPRGKKKAESERMGRAEFNALPRDKQKEYSEVTDGRMVRSGFDGSKRLGYVLATVQDLAPESRFVMSSATAVNRPERMLMMQRMSGTGYKVTHENGKQGLKTNSVGPSMTAFADVMAAFQDEDMLSSALRFMISNDTAVAVEQELKGNFETIDMTMGEEVNRQVFGVNETLRKSLYNYLDEAKELLRDHLQDQTLWPVVFDEHVWPESIPQPHLDLESLLKLLMPNLMGADAKGMLDLNKWMNSTLKSSRVAEEIENNIEDAKHLVQFEQQLNETYSRMIQRYLDGELNEEDLTIFYPIVHKLGLMLETQFLPEIKEGKIHLKHVDKARFKKIIELLSKQQDQNESSDMTKGNPLIINSLLGKDNITVLDSDHMDRKKDQVLADTQKQLVDKYSDLDLNPLPGAIIQRLGETYEMEEPDERGNRREQIRNHRTGILTGTDYWVWKKEGSIQLGFQRVDPLTEGELAKIKFQEDDLQSKWMDRNLTMEERREMIIENWNDIEIDTQRVLLLSAKGGGTGTNFQDNDWLRRFLHSPDQSFDPNDNVQLAGRITRSGQKSLGTNILYYFSDNVFDLRIYAYTKQRQEELAGLTTGDTRTSGDAAAELGKQEIQISPLFGYAARYVISKMHHIFADKETSQRYGLEKYHQRYQEAKIEFAIGQMPEQHMDWFTGHSYDVKVDTDLDLGLGAGLDIDEFYRKEGETKDDVRKRRNEKAAAEYAQFVSAREFLMDTGYWNPWNDLRLEMLGLKKIINKRGEYQFVNPDQIDEPYKFFNRMTNVPRHTALGILEMVRAVSRQYELEEENKRAIPTQTEVDQTKGGVSYVDYIAEIESEPVKLVVRKVDKTIPRFPWSELSKLGKVHERGLIDKNGNPMALIVRDPLNQDMYQHERINLSNKERSTLIAELKDRVASPYYLLARGSDFSVVSSRELDLAKLDQSAERVFPGSMVGGGEVVNVNEDFALKWNSAYDTERHTPRVLKGLAFPIPIEIARYLLYTVGSLSERAESMEKSEWRGLEKIGSNLDGGAHKFAIRYFPIDTDIQEPVLIISDATNDEKIGDWEPLMINQDLSKDLQFLTTFLEHGKPGGVRLANGVAITSETAYHNAHANTVMEELADDNSNVAEIERQFTMPRIKPISKVDDIIVTRGPYSDEQMKGLGFHAVFEQNGRALVYKTTKMYNVLQLLLLSSIDEENMALLDYKRLFMSHKERK